VPRVSPRDGGHLPPTAYINPPYPLGHSSHLLHSSLWPSSHIWSRARELEETPHAGHRRVAGFPVPLLLLPLLCWTGAQTMSIHRTCVIPRRRCSYGAGRHRLVRLHDLEVGFGCLHQQHSCGNVPAHSVIKGMNTTATPLPYSCAE
jgi:hypothetical protein